MKESLQNFNVELADGFEEEDQQEKIEDEKLGELVAAQAQAQAASQQPTIQ